MNYKQSDERDTYYQKGQRTKSSITRQQSNMPGMIEQNLFVVVVVGGVVLSNKEQATKHHTGLR